jgi:predicted dehydrogenase
MRRRDFLATLPLAAKAAPSDRVRIGVIGMGNRAGLLVDQLPAGGEVVAVADCDLPRCDLAVSQRKASWKIFQDYRRLLDLKDIDAVIVATTDHVRVLPCIHAAQAGKDIYAEKPLTTHIAEGRALVNAVRKHNRIFQVGSQQRSMEMNRAACEFVRTGGLGKITLVKAVNYTGPRRYTGLPEERVPDGFDWNLWLGPTPMRPYNKQLHRGWMGWWDYSGGQMTNWGAHGLDQIQWALGMDDSGPAEIWPENGQLRAKYPNGVPVSFELPEGPFLGGAIFIGEKGTVEVVRNNFKTDPPGLITNLPRQEDIDKWRDEVAKWQARYHLQNWLDCIKSRRRPVADVEIGHRSVSVGHLANIARDLNRRVAWDAAAERFRGDAEANALLSRPRRKGFELP